MCEDPITADDILYVRDIIARVEHLRELRDSLTDDDQPETLQPGTITRREDVEAEMEELTRLESLLSDLEGGGGDEEWEGSWYPVTLIRDSYFEDYARDFAEDIGAISQNMAWPCCHIDWAAAAESLQMDYSSVEFDGTTYWYR